MERFCTEAQRGLLAFLGKLIVQSPFDVEQLIKLLINDLGDEQASGLFDCYLKDPVQCKRTLIEILPSCSGWAKSLMHCLRNQGLTQIVNAFTCDQVKDLPNFERLMCCCDSILTMNLSIILPALVTSHVLSADSALKLNSIYNANACDGVRALLAILPKRSPNWYRCFIDALYSTNDSDLLCLAKDIETCSTNQDNDFLSITEAFGSCSLNPSFLSLPPCSRSASGSSGQARCDGTVNPDDDSDDVCDSNNGNGNSCEYVVPVTTKNAAPVELREYQKELIGPALSGRNIVVCAPTGSGKTLVAGEVIKRHLESGDTYNCGGSKRVVFFVPTVQLVDQQAKVLRDYIDQRYEVMGLYGASSNQKSVPLIMAMRSNAVVVMTPALFVNMLNCDNPEDRFSITAASLLVFDECHHMKKDHMYKKIMDAYFDVKFDDQGLRRTSLPKILCLTASLGVGKAESTGAAVDYVLTLCANMDAHELVSVEQNVDELNRFVHMPVDEAKLVPFDSQNDPFVQSTMKIMRHIEQRLEPLIRGSGSELLKIGERVEAPSNCWSHDYMTWVSQLRARAPLMNESRVKHEVISYAEHLRVYHDALVINLHVTTKQAVDYINKEIGLLVAQSATDFDLWLGRLYDYFCGAVGALLAYANVHPNMMLTCLKNLLIDEFAKTPDGRAIVFARTRQLCLALMEFMTSDKDLCTHMPCHLVSINASSIVGGQTEREQQALLSEFRSGQRKIMIATTVAEEGLDIARCNLVVKYNHVTNEIALVQRRGRGRAFGSRSVLITSDAKIYEKEKKNALREQLMKAAIAQIRADGQKAFDDQIMQRQIKVYQDRQMETLIEQQYKKQLAQYVYKILCAKCDAFLCFSTDIRHVAKTYYLPCNPIIWAKVSTHARRPMSFKVITVSAVLTCKGCRQDLGVVIKYNKVYFPSFKAEKLVIQMDSTSVQHALAHTTQQKIQVKKWSKMLKHFHVQPITDHDVLNMFKALNDSNYPKYLTAYDGTTNEEPTNVIE